MHRVVHTSQHIAIIIVAAGRGERFGSDIPKQFLPLGAMPLFAHCLERFRRFFPNADIVLVTRPDITDYVDAHWLKHVRVTQGGASRQASVKNGLLAVEKNNPDIVMIHDAARPFVCRDVCMRLIHALKHYNGAIAALAMHDTIQQVENEVITDTLDRTILRAAQTPQAFHYDALRQAYERVNGEFTDDAGLLRSAGFEVCTVQGDERMFKVTTSQDMQRAHTMMHMQWRVGQGYDVHQFSDFAPGEAHYMTLGGVKVKHTRRLKGHSDADVVLHAITDALLGAIGQGDIGQHFPPSNPDFRDMDSAHFVTFALNMLKGKGGVVNNCDITIIGERPKIGKVRDEMRCNIAAILQCDISRVNVKATTTEKLGFEGKEEGLACQAIISVTVPSENDTLAP